MKITGHIDKNESFNSPLFGVWSKALAHIGDTRINVGLDKLLTFDGYIKNPGAFITLCQSELSDYGLPEVEEAFLDACSFTSPIREYPFKHPAIYHAAMDTGLPMIRLGKGKDQFKHAYTRRTEQVMGGIQLKIPENKLIEQDKGVLPGRERTKEHIEALMKLLG